MARFAIRKKECRYPRPVEVRYKGRMKTRLLLSSLAALSLLRAEAPTSGFRADFLRQLADVEKKVTSLAQAMPQEKYSWRPAEGVRSVSEVFVHIAGANFLFPNFAGVKPPAGVDRNAEKTVTNKAEVVALIKKSFDHARTAIIGLSDADMDKPTKLFGRETVTREVFFIMANHMHEHLGQAIAYARTGGVTPPWSMKEN